jgi:hypothetical protein
VLAAVAGFAAAHSSLIVTTPYVIYRNKKYIGVRFPFHVVACFFNSYEGFGFRIRIRFVDNSLF